MSEKLALSLKKHHFIIGSLYWGGDMNMDNTAL